MKAAQSDPTPIGNFMDSNEVGPVTQRMAFGPDMTERAGEVGKYLASGGFMEDIAFHCTSPELYNTAYNRLARCGCCGRSQAGQ